MSAAIGDRPAISVLVVTWRTPDDAERCVTTALDELADLRAEVVVVDNASGDGTIERLRARFGDHPAVVLIANDENRGFAGGNADALDASTGDVVVVCNPDLRLRRAALDRLLALVEEPDVGLATCALIGLDGRPQTLHRSLPDLRTVAMTLTRPGAAIDHRLLGRRHQRRYRLLERPRLGVVDIGQAAGALMVLRRSVIDGALGGVLFDESLPILVNDVDLSRRVHDAGLRVVVDWDAWMVHEGGVSLRQLDARALRDLRWDGLRRYYETHEPPWRRRMLGMLQRAALDPSPMATAADAPVRDDPLVSVVIPAFNYGGYLAEAIDSALAQRGARTEVLVVDDGSTDDTPEVLERYGDAIRVHRQDNAGLSAARNVGAQLARGDLLVYLDADNKLHPDFVARCRDALLDHPTAGFAYPQVHHFGAVDRTTELGAYDLDAMRRRNEIDACCLLRRHLVLDHPYDEGNRVGWEDWDLFLTLAEHGWGGVLVDEPLLEYRRHDASMTSSIASLRRRRLRLEVLRRHRRLVGTRAVLHQWWRVERMRAGLARRRLLGQRSSSTTP